MIKINLVPQEILAKEIQRQQAVQAGVVVGVVLAMVVGVSLMRWHKATSLEAHLKERQAEYDKLAKIVAQVEELERTAGAVRTRLAVITDLLKGRALYPYFMSDLAETFPGDVWVGSVGTTFKEGNQLIVNLTANSLSSYGVSTWIRNLQKSGKFTEPSLSVISISGTESERTHSFSIKTEYKSPKL